MMCQNPLANSYLKQYNNLKILQVLEKQLSVYDPREQSTIQEDYASLNKSTLKWRHMAN